jgi:hypothetical protein
MRAERQQAWWDRGQTEARGELVRIERGESLAPPSVIRCLAVFVAAEVRR